MESLEINVAKLQENMSSIKKDIEEIKADLKHATQYISNEFKTLRKELSEEYITKERLVPVESRVSKIETVLNKGMWIILAAIIVSILSIAFPRGV